MKRFHHKTRRGCSGCRRRRVKCDEMKPSCKNCIRNHLECSFEIFTPITLGQHNTRHEALPIRSNNERARRTRPIRPATFPKADSCLTASPLNLESMELLHHYTSLACLHLGGKHARPLWQIEFPRMALSHDFLMHGILAISAVHLATLQPARSIELRRRAALSEHLAMPSFRALTAQLDDKPEHVHAVFAFAGFTPLYLLAQSDWLDAPAGRIPSSNDDQPHWFHVFRGVVELLRQRHREIATGPFSRTLVRTRAPVDCTLNPDDSHLLVLYPLLQPSPSSTSSDVHELMICREALDELRRVSALPYSPCKTLEATATFYIWPGSISEEYVKLIHARRKEALVVLAGYTKLLRTAEVRDVWFVRGVGEAMLKNIDEELGQGWKCGIEWAL